MGGDDDDEGLLWVDEQDEAVAEEANASIEANNSERVAGLEAELARTRAELTDVRRELAAKVISRAKSCKYVMHGSFDHLERKG